MAEKFKTESSIRSAIKGISWRIVGTLDTILISRLISGQNSVALKIGSAELVTKYILYFFHERIWNLALSKAPSKPYQTILKTITWRIIGTADTILLAWFFTGNWQTGLQIGSLELVTKMILYYFHERLWLKIKLGTFRKLYIRFIKK
jgi:uncharacterized membrane protein